MILLKKVHIVLLCVAAFVAALLFTLFFLSLESGDAIPKGVTAGGVDIGGMARDEAVQKLSSITLGEYEEAVIKTDIYTITFTAGDIGAHFDAEKTVDEILSGERGFFEKVKSHFTKTEHAMAVDLDEVLLDSAIANKLYGIEREVTQMTYEVTPDGIVVTNGKSGLMLDRAKASEAIREEFGKKEREAKTVDLERVSPEAVDSAAFLSQFGSVATDATFVRNEDGSILVTQEQFGVTIDMAQAEAVMRDHTAEGEVYTVPAEIIMPKYTKAELEAGLFADTLGTYNTSFATSAQNRADNVALAASSINSIIMMPGDVFSFNQALGERTIANGYKVAHAYAAGEVVDQVGGGICQVSSTLYNTVLLANLNIVERRSHQMTVAYVPLGRDATVNWGTTDFRFSNDTYYPIRIDAYTSGKNVYVSIVGTQPDKTMKVEIETKTLSTLDPPVTEENDPTLPVGQSKITKQGSRGYVVDAYRVVYSNGQEVKREKLVQSRYNPTKTIKKVGTMVVEQPVAEQPVAEATGSLV